MEKSRSKLMSERYKKGTFYVVSTSKIYFEVIFSGTWTECDLFYDKKWPESDPDAGIILSQKAYNNRLKKIQRGKK